MRPAGDKPPPYTQKEQPAGWGCQGAVVPVVSLAGHLGWALFWV
jgi:hypothetical protein